MDVFSKPFNKLKKDEIALIRAAAEERFDFFNAYFLDTVLQPFHLRWFEFQLSNPRTLILGPRACWKCASANSLIPTPEGLAYFKDFLPSTTRLPFVESVDRVVGSCLGVTKALHLFSNGINEVLEIETEDGFTLQVTPEHRLLVWDGNRLAFSIAGALSIHDRILFRCDWQSFSDTNINPFNVPDHLWFRALAYFYVTYPNWAQVWDQKHARKEIAQPLWRHFKHKSRSSLPLPLEEFLDSHGFGSHLIPKPLRHCTSESAKIIASAFWWINQHVKFTVDQAKEVQNWFLNLGIPFRRVGSTLTHKNAYLRAHFHKYFLQDATEFKYSDEQIIELASLTFLEVTCSSFVPPLIKYRALQVGRNGFTDKPTLAARFVSEFLDHAPRLRKFAFMFRFPFFLQKVSKIGEFEALTLDLTTVEGNYLINGVVGHNSTVCGKNYGIWRALRNPNIRIGIVSKSALLSSMFVSQIKHIFESNEKIAKVWDHLIDPKKAQKWNNSEVTLVRPVSLANATFTSLGVGTSLAGHHFDILIFDDVVDTDHQMSPALRKRLWDWFRFVAMQTLSVAEETQAHVIGTLYHPDDLYHHIIRFEREGRGGWRSSIQAALNGDGTSFWEEMFPLGALQEIEVTYGNDVFQLQYQNDPDFGMSGITWDMFEACYYKPENIDLDRFDVVIGVDLAAPESERRYKQSAFAIVVVGLDRQTNAIFVLDVLKRTNVRMVDQRAFIENFYSRYPNTSTIQIESFAVQSYFHEYLRESDMVLPYTKIQTPGSKEARFDHVFSLIAANRLFFQAHVHNELLEEIINFPNTSADLIDALFMAIRGYQRAPSLRFLSW